MRFSPLFIREMVTHGWLILFLDNHQMPIVDRRLSEVDHRLTTDGNDFRILFKV